MITVEYVSPIIPGDARPTLDWAWSAKAGDVPPFPALDAPPNFGLAPETLDVVKTVLKARGLCIMQREGDVRVEALASRRRDV